MNMSGKTRETDYTKVELKKKEPVNQSVTDPFRSFVISVSFEKLTKFRNFETKSSKEKSATFPFIIETVVFAVL
jgi:hypothetical protein